MNLFAAGAGATGSRAAGAEAAGRATAPVGALGAVLLKLAVVVLGPVRSAVTEQRVESQRTTVETVGEQHAVRQEVIERQHGRVAFRPVQPDFLDLNVCYLG